MQREFSCGNTCTRCYISTRAATEKTPPPVLRATISPSSAVCCRGTGRGRGGCRARGCRPPPPPRHRDSMLPTSTATSARRHPEHRPQPGIDQDPRETSQRCRRHEPAYRIAFEDRQAAGHPERQRGEGEDDVVVNGARENRCIPQRTHRLCRRRRAAPGSAPRRTVPVDDTR